MWADLFSVRRGFSAEAADADGVSLAATRVSPVFFGDDSPNGTGGIGPPVRATLSRRERTSAWDEIASGSGDCVAARSAGETLPYSEWRSATICGYNSVAA